MKKLLSSLCCCTVGMLLAACSSHEKSDNPYTEAHIVDVVPHYQITPDVTPNLKKPIDQMSEDEVYARYGALQQLSSLTPAQQTEFRLLAERIKVLSEYKLKTEQSLHINK